MLAQGGHCKYQMLNSKPMKSPWIRRLGFVFFCDSLKDRGMRWRKGASNVATSPLCNYQMLNCQLGFFFCFVVLT